MKARLISALVVVVTFAQHAAAQSLATPRDITVPEPSTGLLLGLSAGAYGLYRFLRRR